MTKKELIQKVLALPPSDREEVVDEVLASLSDDLPSQLSPAEQQEMLRRVKEFETHPENFVSWEEVKAQLAAQRARRSA